ncbi:PhaM family polyhydroxyalkanoate granule multifunctional regulatory protein [Massilia consociata]|uniref:PhaM family polyhydroxyalkanoate granule multifunctional regulatory protein n=1 Tax=Massilia consociata TaxID=760117 RepID=A0ABV6FJJ2_9BURK
MLKPPMPNAAGMTDTLEFVKNLWGGMGIPGVSMPGMTGSSLSIDELDKKIADLKAVEAWLNLNIGMLRGTIQALEVQRGTLATLKAMGDSMAQAMGRAGTDPSLAAPFAQFFAQPGAASPPPPAQPAAAPSAAPSAPPSAAQAPAGTEQAAANAMPAAVAWWNLLQEQFRQAVASAIPPQQGADGATAKAPAEPKAAGGSPLDVSGGAPEPAPASPPSGSRVGRNPRTRADKA